MQTGIKTARRNVKSFRYVDDTTLTAETKEELKSLLMKVKQESEEVGLKLCIRKTDGILSHHFMANRWENSGNGGRLFFLFLDGGVVVPKSLKIVTTAMKLKDAYSS